MSLYPFFVMTIGVSLSLQVLEILAVFFNSLIGNILGKTKKEIKNTQFYNYVYYGDGDTVIYQSPDQGEKIKEGDTIMLYMG